MTLRRANLLLDSTVSEYENNLRELGVKIVELYTPEEMLVWLFSPQKLLDHWAPAALIQQRRTQEVIRLLDQIREGV